MSGDRAASVIQLLFFFSSRRRHTRFSRDWSSDVCSSDLARIMTSMLREVVLHGTAIAASGMKYPLAGKTGTTNDFTDAWFIGFSPSMTCGVWVGFDEKKSLGNKESGSRAALPIWKEFMKIALAGL